MALGSIEDFATHGKPSRHLRSDKVDVYSLDTVSDDATMVVCKLFVDSTTPGQMNKSKDLAPQIAASATLAEQARPAVKSVIATRSPPPVKVDSAAFIKFLRDIVGGRESDWPMVRCVGDVLPRVKAVREAKDELKAMEWGKSNGGYQVPKDYSDIYGGHPFTQDELLLALNIKHTSAANDAKLFEERVMDKLPQLHDWYDQGDKSSHHAHFAKMKISEFKIWQKNALKHVKDKEASLGEAGKGQDKAKKKVKVSRKYLSDDEDEELARAGPSKRARTKYEYIPNSSDLEDS